MRKLSLLFMLTALMAVQASALDTKELLATIAMPLAVAAVADVAGVPSSDLADLVVAMNRANVPATQFVEVIRYTPVALVDPSDEEPFVAYVQERHVEGVRGDALATRWCNVWKRVTTSSRSAGCARRRRRSRSRIITSRRS